MKVSFITTILNEEKTIIDLLDSLQQQTQKPDEIIIIDAGSIDKTTKLIKSHSLKTRLITKKDFNPSKARNYAVKQAKHSILALSDAGCRLDKYWLKRITQPFKNKQVDAVAGFYLPDAKTVFQKCLAPFVVVMPDKLDKKTFLPSSRSIAFRRSAWEKAGQYPEHLRYCDDLVFAKNLKQKTKLIVKPQAIVYWYQADNLIQFFKQIKNYASGDVQAKYQPHLKKILTTFGRYLIFISLPIIFPFYLLWPIIKHFRYVNHPLAIIYLPILQITADIGIMLGSLYGLLKRRN